MTPAEARAQMQTESKGSSTKRCLAAHECQIRKPAFQPFRIGERRVREGVEGAAAIAAPVALAIAITSPRDNVTTAATDAMDTPRESRVADNADDARTIRRSRDGTTLTGAAYCSSDIICRGRVRASHASRCTPRRGGNMAGRAEPQLLRTQRMVGAREWRLGEAGGVRRFQWLSRSGSSYRYRNRYCIV